ncbi:hypothetical protein KDA_53140 [Dictyobacter alpinus]|uniref:Uncharacterized protein n=1 Tax=Dictyobacter alpinus TaxID=2014873 RepID=A0A402BEV7_9CHLR|nr:hypothetical protein KDA_53140 [Dictyobacter alpinus]
MRRNVLVKTGRSSQNDSSSGVLIPFKKLVVIKLNWLYQRLKLMRRKNKCKLIYVASALFVLREKITMLKAIKGKNCLMKTYAKKLPGYASS